MSRPWWFTRHSYWRLLHSSYLAFRLGSRMSYAYPGIFPSWGNPIESFIRYASFLLPNVCWGICRRIGVLWIVDVSTFGLSADTSFGSAASPSRTVILEIRFRWRAIKFFNFFLNVWIKTSSENWAESTTAKKCFLMPQTIHTQLIEWLGELWFDDWVQLLERVSSLVVRKQIDEVFSELFHVNVQLKENSCRSSDVSVIYFSFQTVKNHVKD